MLDQLVESLIAGVDGPTALDNLVQEVLARKPSKAKDPVKTVTTHLRDPYGRNKPYVFLDQNTVMPLRLALKGVRFRITSDRQMVSQGAVQLYDESLWAERGLQTAYARLPSARDYPGDHWTTVIEKDGRMRWQDLDCPRRIRTPIVL